MPGKECGPESCKPVYITSLLSSKGYLWIGTSVGCVLTLSLPRLEGVPQIKGRPTVAYHAHTGPVKFLSAVHCGASQLPLHSPGGASTDSCAASENSYDTTTPETGSNKDIFLDGVTETETEDHRGLAVSDDYSTFRSPDSMGDDFTALARNRWISTPDLRDLPQSSEEDDIQMLYGSLLQDNLEEDLEQELLGPNRVKRRYRGALHLSMVTNKVNKFSEAVLRLGSPSGSQSPASRFATLPVLREEAGPHREHSKLTQQQQQQKEASRRSVISTGESEASESTSSDTVSMEGTATDPTSPAVEAATPRHRTLVPAYPTMVMSYHANTKKALVVVSGGEGHVNWNNAKAADLKYEDICLLLWQCRL